jgi:hypothetical protein
MKINDSSSNLNALSSHLVQHIANTYLNPKDRSSLSACNKRLNILLPSLLQMSISSSCCNEFFDHHSSVEGRLLGIGMLRNVMKDVYVTPVDEDNWDCCFETPPGHNFFYSYENEDFSAPSTLSPYERSLKANECLIYGRRYYFWSFDYERSNFVFLGRHTRHAAKDNNRMEYSLAARPLCPNQSWEVIATNPHQQPGDVVQWGDNVGLIVGGHNPDPRHPDSMKCSYLSCSSTDNDSYNIATTTGPIIREEWNWCFVQDRMKVGPNEVHKLLPRSPCQLTKDVFESKKLIVHAIPEACDEGEYQLYSPASLRHGLATCDGLHIKVNFDHWIEKGIMHVRAAVLPFTLGIPILETDYGNDTTSFASSPTVPSSPLANLLHIKSARWGCLIYYMAVAADVSEGKPIDMNRFLRRVTDHQDHTVHINEAKDFVYVDVRGNKVKLDATELPRPNTTTSPSANDSWCFLLSW